MAIFYVDLENGNDSNNGTTFALRKKTITAAVAVAGATDTVRVMASIAPTAAGVNGTFANASRTVTLSAALNATIDDCESGWTASSNVTLSYPTANRKSGSASLQAAIGSAFTTGTATYKTLAAATDFSAYQQVTFWVQVGTPLASGSVLSLRLCSDTAGATTVNTIPIQFTSVSGVQGIPVAGYWVPITVNNAAALGSSIQSVALYVDTAIGSSLTVQIDNIVAAKAPGAGALTLQSLVGKLNSFGAGGTDAETWWTIQSINGTNVQIDSYPQMVAGSGNGYYGVSETAALYVRETIKQTLNLYISINKSGVSSTATFNVSGGWNRTDMSTQTADSWIDQCLTNQPVFYMYLLWCTVSGFSLVRGNYNFSLGNGGGQGMATLTFNCLVSAGSSWFGQFYNPTYGNILNVKFINSAAGASYCFGGIVNISGGVYSCVLSGYNTESGADTINGPATFANNGGSNPSGAITILGGRLTVNDVTFTANYASFDQPGQVSNNSALVYCNRCIFNDTTILGLVFGVVGSQCVVFSQNHNNTPNNHKQFLFYGNITTDSSVTHGASGISWKLSPWSTNRDVNWPLPLRIARVAVNAGTAVTISAYLRRDNTGITGQLYTPANPNIGVSTEVSDTMTAAANTWDQRTITFTPTASGVADIYVRCYGGSTYNVWVDDMTINQA